MKKFKILIIMILASVLFIPGVIAQTNYNVKFNKNGGTGKTASVVCTTNKNCKLTANAFKKNGYVFDGWNTKKNGKGITYKNKQKVKNITNKESITLYAIWKPITYTVKFDGNGKTSGKIKNLKMTYDKKVKLTKNAFKKTGYLFVGWNTKKNGKGTTYKDAAKVKNLTKKNKATVTLYAMWKPITYTIKFNGNGKTTGENKNITCLYDSTCKILTSDFKQKGYTFTSWNTKADGSGITYNANQNVKNLTNKNNGEIELYAMWTNNNKDLIGTWAYNTNEEVIRFTDTTLYPDISDKEESEYYVENSIIYLSGAELEFKIVNGKLYLGNREFIKIK